MRVDRSRSGEYASPKRIRITHDVYVESLFLFSMISVTTHHASRITLHASRVCGVVAHTNLKTWHFEWISIRFNFYEEWSLSLRYLSKHKKIVRHLYHVGPTSSTYDIYNIHVIQMFCLQYCGDGEIRDREVACSASDHQGLNFEFILSRWQCLLIHMIHLTILRRFSWSWSTKVNTNIKTYCHWKNSLQLRRRRLIPEEIACVRMSNGLEETADDSYAFNSLTAGAAYIRVFIFY